MELPLVIQWSEAMSVGHDLIDEDHKNLVRMINRLFGAVMAEQPHAVVNRVLNDLVDYTVYHFKREEVLMERYAYPDAPAHCKAHRDLIGMVESCRAKFVSGEAVQLADEIEEFLRDWLVRHILYVDKALADFLSGRGESEQE